ncbi:MAG: hypothetical protein GFH27_549293n334 [Chloroflexi bacterium AL-W]|nr:hypothetical protein [Chloroflexi bacterium AL-N1]NOK67551.1 hypothetical protein [Chloroflexi bacterium AL-N10]NOK75679.1 hypothetical protein [Chloroflexi bacterium AL-N5]NOK82467.1 hypothetical protein [Chloroflexi bacterium AL-W]NOK90312.1 hypothetical protein [Chloroflexi bacterium AL-N15]
MTQANNIPTTNDTVVLRLIQSPNQNATYQGPSRAIDYIVYVEEDDTIILQGDAPMPSIDISHPSVEDHEAMTVLRIATHDLLTPLTSIRSYADMLASGVFGPMPEEQRWVIERIQQASGFMSRVTQDLSDAIDPGQDGLSLRNRIFEPEEVAKEILALCQPQAQDHQHTLTLRCVGKLRPMTNDPERLQQVLFNLMSNAIRYANEGSIRLVVEQDGDWIEFRVEDQGPGIPELQQQTIWKFDSRLTNEGKGRGLGLYIVQQLVQAMGGLAGVDSTEGVGSSFWVRFPVDVLDGQ